MSFLFLNASTFGVDKHTLTDGAGLTAPRVVSATSIAPNTVRVVFDRDMDFHIALGRVLDPASYSIQVIATGAPLDVARTTKVNETTIDLTTIFQAAVAYRVTVDAAIVRDAWNNLLDENYDTADFTGTAPTLGTATWLTSLLALEAGLQEEHQVGFLPDLDPPYLQNEDPAPLEPSVPRTDPIVFELMDDDTGVDVNSVIVRFDGVLAWQFDAPQAGYSGTRTPIAGGHRYSIQQLAAFPESADITIAVYARDQAPLYNVLDTSYTFTTAGTAPYLQNRDPAPGALDVDPTLPIKLEIVDPDTGIDPTSVWLKHNGAYCYWNQASQPGYVVTRIPVAGGYRYTIQAAGLLPAGSNSIEVYARNNAEHPNTLNTSYGFFTADVTAPRLIDAFPAAGDVNVTFTTPIAFKIVDDDQVVLATVQLFVDGALVYDGATDTFAAGWASSFKSGSPATGFSFCLIPPEPWSEGQEVTVGAIAEDPTGLRLNTSYSFTAESAVEFPFSSYRFIMEAVRSKDRRSPGIIQPFMEMIDERWKSRIFDRATEALGTLFDPMRIDERWLPFLLAQVGFTRDLSFEASVDEVRKIVADGVRYWNHKPSELAVEDAVRMCTGNRFRIGGFFDFRMQSDWTHVLEVLEDFDPVVLDFAGDNDIKKGLYARSSVYAPAGYPGDHYVVFGDADLAKFKSQTQYQYFVWINHPTCPENEGIYEIEECLVNDKVLITKRKIPTRTGYVYGTWALYSGMSEFRSEVRVVDDPSGAHPVNRDLLRFLINMIRPTGERFDIIYLGFLEQFLTPGDLDQWTVTGDVTVPEPGGDLVVAAGAQAQCSVGNRLDWFDQSTAFKVLGAAGSTATLQFWYNDDDNVFWVELNFDAHTVKLYKRITGATTQVGSTVSMPTVIAPNRYIGLRVDALKEGVGVRVRVKVNGETQIDQYSGPPTVVRGGPGIKATGATVKLALVEVLPVPTTIDRAGPNP